MGGDICEEPAASMFAMFRTQGILSHKTVLLMNATRDCKLKTRFWWLVAVCVLPPRDGSVDPVTRVAYTVRPGLCLCDQVFVSVSEVNQTRLSETRMDLNR